MAARNLPEESFPDVDPTQDPTETPPPVSDEPARMPVLSFSADSVADAALQSRLHNGGEAAPRCDACDAPIVGEPNGRGLFMWTRGDEHRFEEPALCEKCATAIGVTALASWNIEEEEG